MASCAMLSQSSRVSTPPVGLAGVLTMSSRVRGGDQAAQLLDVETEVVLLADRRRHRRGADEVHQRAVDRVTGVGNDHLVARLDDGQQQEGEDVLAAGHEHDVLERSWARRCAW